jgi:TusA-related sulfurtransferase
MSESQPHARADHVIDARDWEPPEPFVATMDTLAVMAPNARLLLILTREPHPLYRALLKQGYRYDAQFTAEGVFEILIWREEP